MTCIGHKCCFTGKVDHNLLELLNMGHKLTANCQSATCTDTSFIGTRLVILQCINRLKMGKVKIYPLCRVLLLQGGQCCLAKT